MTGSMPSSVSRYRPAILILTGAAAAWAAYLVYNSLQSSSPEGLHRSNAVRRSNRRPRRRTSGTSRLVQQLQHDPAPLGTFNFFGERIALDARNVVPPAALRELAERIEPTASPDIVDTHIRQLYDTFLDRLLGLSFSERALSVIEREAVTNLVGERVPGLALARALQRHQSRFALEETGAALVADGVESIAPTELFSDDDSETDSDPDGQTLQRTLYHIAEDRARQEGVIHRGITCNGCDTKPIRGIRWRCANCPDYDLCSDCEATNSHIKTHIFYKVRVPAPYLALPKQEPVYPGRPHMMSPSIRAVIKKRLVSETRMESEEIEALWDQFTCLAAAEWDSDPNHVGWALDRHAFNHAFIPRYSSFVSAPNLIYDRIFAYFDTDQNALVGFEEFVKGLDGLHSTDTRIKLRIAFNGYDVDSDGHISRRDVLRIFRAHFAIEKEATRNYLAEAAEELSVRGALDIIHSSQPLGSAFTHNGIPAGDRNGERLRDKPSDDDNNQPPIVDDALESMDREELIRGTHFTSQRVGVRNRSSDEAVHERWARRQYYTDEEEGLTRPEGADDSPISDEPDESSDGAEEPQTPELERPRGSRSSSRVRFQDDVEIETRSNTSSSRPVRERWGGYEIPEPEKDLGKEVLYQVTQQAFNELLDPLFKDKEDHAMDAFATRSERRRRTGEIDRVVEEFNNEKETNKAVFHMGIFRYVGFLMHHLQYSDFIHIFRDKDKTPSRKELRKLVKTHIRSAEESITHLVKPLDDSREPDDLDLWNIKMHRLLLQQQLIDTVDELGIRHGWLSQLESPASSSGSSDKSAEETIHRDPTLPQFRPNSLAELEAQAEEGSVSTSEFAQSVSDENEMSSIKRGRVSLMPHFIVPAQEAVENTPSAPPNRTTELATNTGTGTDNETGNDGNNEASRTEAPPDMEEDEVPKSAFHPKNDPIIHFIYVKFPTRILCTTNLPLDLRNNYDPGIHDPAELNRRIRRVAFENPASSLHVPFLASLEIIEREISERKGSGMLNFDEFETCVSQGRLRFLESWMDWVSF